MMSIAYCEECGKSTNLPFHLVWTNKENFCDKCHHSKPEQQRYDFCSGKCLQKFVNKFVGHKHNYMPVFGLSTEEVGVDIICKCNICGLTKVRKTTRKDVKFMKERYKQ